MKKPILFNNSFCFQSKIDIVQLHAMIFIKMFLPAEASKKFDCVSLYSNITDKKWDKQA